MKNEVIMKLINKGARRWTKGEHDRLYIDTDLLGLTVERYNSGNISYAEFQGEKISNTTAAKLAAVTIYIDLNTDEIHGTGWNTAACNTMKSAAQDLIDTIEAEVADETIAPVEEQTDVADITITDVISAVCSANDGVLQADGSYITEFKTFRLDHIISDRLCIISGTYEDGEFWAEHLLWKYSDGWCSIYEAYTHGQILDDLRSGRAYEDISIGAPGFGGLIRTIVDASGILNEED